MNYQPVNYITEYVICATVFFIIIMTRYFGTRRFPNQKNYLYALVLWVTLVDLITDVLSALIIDNVFLIPLPVVYFVNTLFYALQTVLPMLMTAFTLAMTRYLDKQLIRRGFLLLLPGLAMLAVLLINPFTQLFFYVDPVRGYLRGPAFFWCYGVSLFYMVVTLYATIKYRKQMQRIEYTNVWRFWLVALASIVIQFAYPRLMITGVALAIAVTLMYFTIQNPSAMLDTTTGAFTYEAMLNFLRDRALAREHIQLVAVRIRNMPRINELLGARNGSLLLKEICRFLGSTGKDVWVFRMRGSCFVAVARSSDGYDELCKQVRTRIGLPWMVNQTEIMLQATVCYVTTTELSTNPISPEDTVNYLESIFLQSDRSTEFIREIHVGVDLLDQLHRRKTVEAALREAIDTGNGLEIYLQPLWNVKRRCFDSAEVLLRFSHPTLGSIAPDEFVPIAEGCGLVTAMDELVIRKTCAFLHECGLSLPASLKKLEINLSAIEFMHHRLPAVIDEIIQRYGVDPRLLCFEITETAATESFEILKECMAEIADKGCGFALDDFGTGYANISQVIQLPFEIVKLDRSMLLGQRSVLEDMTKMFARMERYTVIEGVESAEQAAFAGSVGADYVQGYFYAKPMCRSDFLSFMERVADK